MRAILVHGMGRTPAAMLVLAARLRAAGLHPDLFAYSAALERWEGCVGRLRGFIDRRAAGTDFVVVGHSLGKPCQGACIPASAGMTPVAFHAGRNEIQQGEYLTCARRSWQVPSLEYLNSLVGHFPVSGIIFAHESIRVITVAGERWLARRASTRQSSPIAPRYETRYRYCRWQTER